MITGDVPITWEQQNYIDLSYSLSTGSYERFPHKLGEQLKMQAFICNQVPQKFYLVAEQFQLQKTVCAINKYSPGMILPFHQDTFDTYREKNNVEGIQHIHRYIVFLHDQVPGQQLWINNQVCLGNAGSYFGWIGDASHMCANLSDKDRYVLQVTGVRQ